MKKKLSFKQVLKLCKTHQGFLIFTLIFILTFFLMLPLQDQAFEDDFAYIRTTEHLVKTGQLKLSEWTATALIFQTYWGFLFTKVFGFSIKVLHLSNIFLLYLGLIAFYQLLRRLKLTEYRALIFTLVLLSFPWVFQFTYSFMSDVFYMSLLIISLYFYIRGMQDNSKFPYFLGSLFAGLAFLNRQIAVVIPVSFLIVTTYQILLTKKIPWKSMVYSLGPVAIIIFLYNIWLKSVGPTVSYLYHVLYPLKEEYLPHILPFHLNRIGLTNYHYIDSLIIRGLGYFFNTIGFLLPIFIIYKINLQKTLRLLKDNIAIILITLIVVAGAYGIDGLYNHKITKFPPDLVLRYDKILLNWDVWWLRFVFISLPIWVIILAVTVKYFLESLFRTRKKPLVGHFKFLMGSYLLFFIIFIVATLRAKFPFLFLSQVISLNYLLELFKDSWFFLLVISLFIISVIYFTTIKQVKKINTQTIIFLFLGLILVFTLGILSFLNSFYYQEYIIQFIPLVVIWVAYIFRNIEINHKTAFIVVSLMLLFSLQITRYRYQFEGTKWQLGNKLIEQGVNPYNIGVNWAWRPYWFFESSFTSAVREFGGNKYNVPEGRIGNWFAGTSPGNNYYFIVTSADPNISKIEIYNKKPIGNKEVIMESEPLWIFWKMQKVVGIKNPEK